MLSEEEKKNLRQRHSELRSDISSLKSKLSDKNAEKEASFSNKDSITGKIQGLIDDIKSLKKQRDDYTSKVKQFKKQRDDLSGKIKTNLEELNKHKDKKNSLIKTYDIKGDPLLIKKEIEKIELKIQTEPMAFNKEQKLMKEIKEKKKKLEEAKGLGDVLEAINKLNRDLRQVKKDRDSLHKKIQGLAQESQKRHESLIERSSEIDELKTKEEDVYKKFFDFKKEYTDINNQLKEKLVELNNISNKLDVDKKEIKKIRVKKQEEQLKSKAEEVDEKIKKGKKLTTEDLLVFQKTAKDEE